MTRSKADAGIGAIMAGAPLLPEELHFIQALEEDGADAFEALFAEALFEPPVTPEKFLDTTRFTGEIGKGLFPVWRRDFVEYASGPFKLLFLAGSIGSGKNFFARLVVAWELYLILLLRRPQEYFKLDKSANIYVNIFSLKGEHAAEGFYAQIRKLIETADFFTSRRLRTHLASRVELALGDKADTGRGFLVIKALAPVETNAIGKEVILNILDEVNFWVEVGDSKRAKKGSGSREYKAAEAVFDASIRRVKSRMLDEMGEAFVPSKFICLSSQKYYADFMNRKLRDHADDTDAFIRRYANWETKPWLPKVKEWLYVNAGEDREPTITPKPDETFPDHIRFPAQYREVAETNIVDFLVDFAGYEFTGKNRFYQAPAVARMFAVNLPNGIAPDVIEGSTGFAKRLRLRVDEKTRDLPHFAAVDLAKNRCNAALAILQITGTRRVYLEGSHGTIADASPVLRVTHLLMIKPPFGYEIDFAEIRLILITLARSIRIAGISYDGYQSVESIKRFRDRGMAARTISTEAAGGPPFTLRRYISSGCITAPHHEILETELETALEDYAAQKIIKAGSIDVIMALAGAAQDAEDYWLKHGGSSAVGAIAGAAEAGAARAARLKGGDLPGLRGPSRG